jgi:hypothetical protein
LGVEYNQHIDEFEDVEKSFFAFYSASLLCLVPRGFGRKIEWKIT